KIFIIPLTREGTRTFLIVSSLVAPRDRDPVIKVLGSCLREFSEMFTMVGKIIKARRIEAVSIFIPDLTLKISFIIGTSTIIAKKPYTTDGIAAIRFIIDFKDL